MKKILLSSVALVGLTAGAMAADLPSRRAPAPYVAVPVFTWAGFYVGVNAGYGFSDSNDNFGSFGSGAGLAAVGPVVTTGVTPLGGGSFGFGNNRSRDGFVGGGQVGYNFQFGNFVAGIEGDIQYTDFGGRNGGTFLTAVPNANIAPGSPNVAFFNRGNNGSDFFGTIRGRVGYAFDRVLVYGTGGAAFRDVDNNNNSFFGFNNTGFNRGDTVGYAVGGGVEYAFTPNITAKIEGLYVNFGGTRGTTVGVTNVGVPVVATGFRNRDDDFAVVRAGINYKFNLF